MQSETNKNNNFQSHYPVMLNEVLHFLEPKSNREYLDCTFGAGGYSDAILKSCDCKVVALDQDPFVIEFAKDIELKFNGRFQFIKTNFADAFIHLSRKKFDGIVLDLGVSSMQLDVAERGFSFQKDAPLDMRMSCDGESAADFINTASEKEIADVIYQYGDERESYRIAKRIVEHRKAGKISTTLELAEIIRQAKREPRSKIDPATKSFQAIRIFINREYDVLSIFLNSCKELLKEGGRIVVVSFHSLEDGIVKSFFKDHSMKKVARSKYSNKELVIDDEKWLKIITSKPIEPTKEEISANIRSRSAKLRAAEKIGG